MNQPHKGMLSSNIETLLSTYLTSFLQGAGGAVELAPGYLKLVYDMVRKAGGVCIADEVQSGFGRTGSHYWGFETQGVIPDIVTMAKVCHLLTSSKTFITSSFNMKHTIKSNIIQQKVHPNS